MTVSVAISPLAIQQFFDNQGNPNVNGTLLTQVGGVNYPTYQDHAGTTPLPNPIPLNSRGEVSNAAGASCQMFLESGVSYTFSLYDKNGNLLNQSNYVVAGLASSQVASASALRVAAAGTVRSPVFIEGSDGGWFWQNPADTTSAENGGTYCGTIIRGTDYATAGVWQRDQAERIELQWFGADHTGVAYSDTPLANAISAAGVNGTVYVDVAGTYKFQTPYVKASSFNCFSIIGAGFLDVEFDYRGVASGSTWMTLVGGSGNLVSAVFKGIRFTGNGAANTARAFEIQGQCGVTWDECQFYATTYATVAPILLHNKATGEFTEFCVVRNSEFKEFSPYAIEYKVTSGNDSFHGSGLLNCVTHSGNGNAVIIGTGSRVYNAPLTINNFASPSSSIISNNSALPCWFYGTMNIEADGTIYTTLPNLCNPGNIYYAGIVNSLGSVNYSGLTQSLGVETSGPEFGNLFQARPAPARSKYFALTSGQSIGSVAAYGPNLTAAMVSVQFFAGNYEYRYYAYAEHNGFGSAGTWTVLATGFTNNSTGWGAPTITVNSSGNIIATNASWPANTVQCAISILPVTGSYTSYF